MVPTQAILVPVTFQVSSPQAEIACENTHGEKKVNLRIRTAPGVRLAFRAIRGIRTPQLAIGLPLDTEEEDALRLHGDVTPERGTYRDLCRLTTCLINKHAGWSESRS